MYIYICKKKKRKKHKWSSVNKEFPSKVFIIPISIINCINFISITDDCKLAIDTYL